MSKKREKYHYSDIVPIVHTKHIVDYHWTKNKAGKNMHKIPAQHEYEFTQQMRKASIEQIKYYMNSMDYDTKMRALRTIKRLEAL